MPLTLGSLDWVTFTVSAPPLWKVTAESNVWEPRSAGVKVYDERLNWAKVGDRLDGARVARLSYTVQPERSSRNRSDWRRPRFPCNW